MPIKHPNILKVDISVFQIERLIFGEISHNYFLLNKKIGSEFSGLHHSVEFLDLAKKSLYGSVLGPKKRSFNEKK